MMSKSNVIVVGGEGPDAVSIELAVEALRKGHLVVAPTETRYGLLARADDKHALARLYKAKRRSIKIPTAIFVRNVEAMAQFGEFTPAARLLASRFFPGPLTLVLRAIVDWKPPLVVDGKIGLRVSTASVVRSLLEKVDFPLTATSANLSGYDDFDTISVIARELGDMVDLYLDAGKLDALPSTVVDCSSDDIRILREGSFTMAAIEAVLKDVAK